MTWYVQATRVLNNKNMFYLPSLAILHLWTVAKWTQN